MKRLNESVLEMIRWNVRTPEEVIGDIRSQIAANHVCAEKICQMLQDNDLDNLDDLADEVIGRTEKSMRESIEKMPDGIYQAEGIDILIGPSGIILCGIEDIIHECEKFPPPFEDLLQVWDKFLITLRVRILEQHLAIADDGIDRVRNSCRRLAKKAARPTKGGPRRRKRR
jgi:hypothetical protein